LRRRIWPGLQCRPYTIDVFENWHVKTSSHFQNRPGQTKCVYAIISDLRYGYDWLHGKSYCIRAYPIAQAFLSEIANIPLPDFCTKLSPTTGIGNGRELHYCFSSRFPSLSDTIFQSIGFFNGFLSVFLDSILIFLLLY